LHPSRRAGLPQLVPPRFITPAVPPASAWDATHQTTLLARPPRGHNAPMRFGPIDIPEPMAASLQAAYAQPPRAYHHFGHVQDVLLEHERVDHEVGWSRPVETALAVLYHDAVYVPGRSDNEARSAVLAREHLVQWMPDANIDADRVAALIELTARHGQLAPADFGADAEAADTRLFLDCDMAILGAPAPQFQRYDQAIAEEYRGVVPGWLYRRKRKAFLRALLDRPRIYLSDYFHARLDARARENLSACLSR
jgi:predicted metal-dependent HD superfamily phosphohydrolase